MHAKLGISKCDVLVAGAGTAGWPAAIAAARRGKKVILVEAKGFVGGTMTTGLPLHGFFGNDGRQVVKGLADELVGNLVAAGCTTGYHRTDLWFNAMVNYNSAGLKPILFSMLADAGVELRLFSRVTEVVMEGNAVKGLVIRSRTGGEIIMADRVVDATGDAVVAHLAGAAMQPASPKLQPPTLVFRVENVDVDKTREWLAANPSYYLTYRLKPGCELTPEFIRSTQFFYIDSKIIRERHYRGEYNPVIDRVMFTVVPGSRTAVFNMLRVLHIDSLDTESLAKATRICYENVMLLAKDLRDCVPGFENSYLCDAEPEIQIRETRRVKGLRTLTGDDVESGARSDDDIALGSYFIDIHSSVDSHGTWRRLEETYGIPYGCLVPEAVENLLVAGRCISGDEVGSSSFRVMGTVMAIGQAAGTAAALSMDEDVGPADLDAGLLRKALADDGAVVE